MRTYRRRARVAAGVSLADVGWMARLASCLEGVVSSVGVTRAHGRRSMIDGRPSPSVSSRAGWSSASTRRLGEPTVTRRRTSPLLAMLGLILCGLALHAPVAAASWAFGKCGRGAERRCYAVTEWYPSAAEEILNTGSHIETTEMYEPSPASEENFVANEQWVGWGEGRYIEAGQKAGYPRTSRTKIFPFYAITNEPKHEYEEYVSHEEVKKETPNLFQFYVPHESESTVGEDWCIKWFGEKYPSSTGGTERCYHHLFGPATELEAGVQAATAAEPLNKGISKGFAVGGKEELWWSPKHPESHAVLAYETFEKEGKPAEATCASEHSPGYGSLEFGAGEGCPLTKGGDDSVTGGDPVAGCSPPTSETLISLSTLEQIVRKEAELDNDAHPTSIRVAQGTLDRALEVMRPGSMTRVNAEASAAQSRCLASTVVLVELQGSFTLHDASLRPGASAPVGTVLRVLLDAYTGEIEGRYLGGTPEAPIERLGATQEIR